MKLLKKNDNGTTGRKRKLREKRFTVVIILIDIIFWLLYTPISISVVISITNIFANILKTQVDLAQYNFFLNVSQLIGLLYHSIFFLTNLVFNKLFRQEICIIVGTRKANNNSTNQNKNKSNLPTGDRQIRTLI